MHGSCVSPPDPLFQHRDWAGTQKASDMTQALFIGDRVEIRTGPHRGKRGLVIGTASVLVHIDGEPAQFSADNLDRVERTQSANPDSVSKDFQLIPFKLANAA
jgi:hypothetical protein